MSFVTGHLSVWLIFIEFMKHDLWDESAPMTRIRVHLRSSAANSCGF